MGKILKLTFPVSMTTPTPGIVNDVSAMLVAKITFLFPAGALSNTRLCNCWLLIVE